MKRYCLSLAALLLLASAAFLHAQTPRYVVIDLGTLGGSLSTGSGINNAGQVAGYSYTTGNIAPHAALFIAGRPPLDLGTLGGTGSLGYGINIAGEVVGSSWTTGNIASLAALFRAGSDPQPLGTLGGNSVGFGINDAGQVAGSYNTAQGRPRAALFRAGSTPQDLSGGSDSVGRGINKAGQVVGYTTHAALFRAGSDPQDLGTLGGSGSTSGGGSINNAGQAAGGSNTPGNSVSHAALFSAGSTTPQDLGTLGGSDSGAGSINNSGQVAGLSLHTGGSGYHAFLFLNDSTQRITDLNTLIGPAAAANWVLERANAINDAGQATGSGVIAGNASVYLATPFWRQIDAMVSSPSGPPPDVPNEFGYEKRSNSKKSIMKDEGCALCTAASMARSLIALNYTGADAKMPIMTPAKLDQLLTLPGADGYTAQPEIPANPNAIPPTKKVPENYNRLFFGKLPFILKRYAKYANIGAMRDIPVTSANLDANLMEQIYTQGTRVVLKLKHFENGVSGPPTKYHFVWVIGKDKTGDWKVGDGGWDASLTDADQAARKIESLNAHIGGGFYQTNGTHHTFVPESLYVYSNLGYKMPPNLVPAAPFAGSGTVKTGTAVFASPGPLDGTTAAVIADASGPVELVLTDPQGRRLGHDQNTGSDFAEIPDASYWTEGPISSISDEDTSPTEGGTSKQLSVPDPVFGTYSVVATGTDNAPASINLEFIGPGGASKRVQANFIIYAGETFTQQITVPTVGTADLAVTQSFLPAQAKVGTPLTYTITVTNNGASTATAPTFTSALPDGVDFVSAVSSTGSCGRSGTVVGGILDDLASGASATIVVTVIPKAAGSLSNSAHIAGFEIDPDESNNGAVSTTEVTTSVDDWRNLHFTAQELGDPNISGLTADAEGDGMRNLLEYGLNLDPKAPDASALTAVATADFTGTYSLFTYTIPPGVTDVVYTVEASSDLTGWSSAGLETVSQVNNPGGTRTVTVRDTTPRNQTTRKFMRLKIVKP